MGEIETPIQAGALYKRSPTSNIRVTGMYINEDGLTQVMISITPTDTTSHMDDTITVTGIEFIDRVSNNEIERINSDHEAWKWRNAE